MRQTRPVCSAPALERGLLLLETLAVRGGLSLDGVTAALGAPRASVHRLLETLRSMKLVERGKDRRYHALVRLAPVRAEAEPFRARLAAAMDGLRDATACTVEWYQATEEALVLAERREPEGVEVRVVARVGFQRRWTDEWEAVTAVGYAFWPLAPRLPRQMRRYTDNGVAGVVGGRRLRSELASVRGRGAAWDDIFNSNGVRRAAVPVWHEEKFAGVLALAESYRFGPGRTAESLAEALLDESRRQRVGAGAMDLAGRESGGLRS